MITDSACKNDKYLCYCCRLLILDEDRIYELAVKKKDSNFFDLQYESFTARDNLAYFRVINFHESCFIATAGSEYKFEEK